MGKQIYRIAMTVLVGPQDRGVDLYKRQMKFPILSTCDAGPQVSLGMFYLSNPPAMTMRMTSLVPS